MLKVRRMVKQRKQKCSCIRKRGDSNESEDGPLSMDKAKLIADLKDRMREVTPLPDEPDFTTSEETMVRFLKAVNWKYKDAEKGLLATVEYRRQREPLRQDCQWCHTRPGYHSMRQVGHDECGRPVVYANFAQASTHKNSVEDIVAHVTYLIENSKATMAHGVSSWVFIIDCTGMTLSACNPKLGYGMTNVMSNHYPERLGMVICLNHSPMFHGVWKALKKLLAPTTVAKMRLIRSESKIQQAFHTYFPEDLAAWLLEEISLNRHKPFPVSQREFWNPPANRSSHDSRGCPSYIKDFIDNFSRSNSHFEPGQRKAHMPHPNIIDALASRVKAVALNPEEEAERLQALSASSAASAATACDLHNESSSGEEDEVGDSSEDVDNDVYNEDSCAGDTLDGYVLVSDGNKEPTNVAPTSVKSKNKKVLK